MSWFMLYHGRTAIKSPAVYTVRSGKDHGVGLNLSLTEFHGWFVSKNLFFGILYCILNLYFCGIGLDYVLKLQKMCVFLILTWIHRNYQIGKFLPLPDNSDRIQHKFSARNQAWYEGAGAESNAIIIR